MLLGKQVRHRMTSGDVGQEPERVLQVRQEPDIGVRKRRALAAELEVVDLGWRVGATDDVEPLLDFVLVLELGPVTRACRGEELVEVELVELALAGDREQLVGHLVGE